MTTVFVAKSNDQSWWCNQNGLVGLALINRFRMTSDARFLGWQMKFPLSTHAFVEQVKKEEDAHMV